MLHPQSLLPVEAGDLCLEDCALRLPEQLVDTKSRMIMALKSNFCIPGMEAIFFNIFIYVILTAFFDNIPLKTKTIFPFTLSEKMAQ